MYKFTFSSMHGVNIITYAKDKDIISILNSLSNYLKSMDYNSHFRDYVSKHKDFVRSNYDKLVKNSFKYRDSINNSGWVGVVYNDDALVFQSKGIAFSIEEIEKDQSRIYKPNKQNTKTKFNCFNKK